MYGAHTLICFNSHKTLLRSGVAAQEIYRALQNKITNISGKKHTIFWTLIKKTQTNVGFEAEKPRKYS